MQDKVVKVGIIGLGIVGGGVARLLLEKQELFSQRLGAKLVLAKASDLDQEAGRRVGLPKEVFTTNSEDIINDPEIDIVVEMIGGLTHAKDYMLQAIEAGKQVVTANKALLARNGVEILAAAKQAGVSLGFEASVGGGIPLISSVRDGLAANQVTQALGILNGTSNYILTQMTAKGVSFDDALQDAQNKGYAEADPTADVEGIDAAHKLAILAGLVTGKQPVFDDIPVEGISGLKSKDLVYADELGYKIKLLATLKYVGEKVEARVHPALVPDDHLLAKVDGNFNALHIQGDWVGDVLLYGQGAGRRPTSSAVVSDILMLAREILAGCPGRLPALGTQAETDGPLDILPAGDTMSKYYFRFTAEDNPGVMASISHVLGYQGISIEAVIQKGSSSSHEPVPIVMLTHEANEAAVKKAILAIDNLPAIASPTMLIRKA
jgi:homoserine dehydrogenase